MVVQTKQSSSRPGVSSYEVAVLSVSLRELSCQAHFVGSSRPAPLAYPAKCCRRAVLQMTYTTLFGWYAAFLLWRTGERHEISLQPSNSTCLHAERCWTAISSAASTSSFWFAGSLLLPSNLGFSLSLIESAERRIWRVHSKAGQASYG